jgi:hypothetical protein
VENWLKTANQGRVHYPGGATAMFWGIPGKVKYTSWGYEWKDLIDSKLIRT